MTPPTDRFILNVQGVSKSFGGLKALQGVDLQVKTGEFHAIIGPNGAGKSTFFNVLTGLLRPDQGQIWINGVSTAGFAPHRLIRLGVGRTFQITRIFPSMSVLENLQVALIAHRHQHWQGWLSYESVQVQRAKELLDLVGLSAQINQLAYSLAHGDKKRLELAIVLANQPKLLLLDEPTAGMAAQERLAAIKMVHQVATQLGVSCVFTEHDMAVVFAVSTRITVLHQGQVLTQGLTQEVRESPLVQQVYLGESIQANEGSVGKVELI